MVRHHTVVAVIYALITDRHANFWDWKTRHSVLDGNNGHCQQWFGLGSRKLIERMCRRGLHLRIPVMYHFHRPNRNHSQNGNS